MRVAIITTVNDATWLHDAIASVADQTFQDWMQIVWCDGVRVTGGLLGGGQVRIESYPHQGRVGSLIGASKVLPQFEYIGLLDADDILHPSCLEKCVQVMDDFPSASFVYTDHAEMNEDGKTARIGPTCHAQNTRENHLRGFSTQHFRLMRRSAFDQVGGFDPSFETAMDYDLCLRLEEVGPVLHLPEVLYYKRKHPNQISVVKAQQQSADAYRARRNAIARDAAKRRGESE